MEKVLMFIVIELAIVGLVTTVFIIKKHLNLLFPKQQHYKYDEYED